MRLLARDWVGAILGWVIGVSAAIAGAQERPWYEERSRPGANFHDIVKSHQRREAAKQSAREDDLTSLLLRDPRLYEQERDFRFNRWKAYVEPRVSPSGDLSLLHRAQAEIARLVLEGEAASNPADRHEHRGDWEALGPFARGTWGAGRLNWLEFHPTDDSAMMVGSPSGGLWFTEDAGQTWFTTTDRIAVLGAAWAVYHPVHPDIIYLGTGDGYSGDTRSIGVLKSMDGGRTWTRTGLTYSVADSRQIMKLAVDARRPDRLLVATSSGVQYSLDGGITFVPSIGIPSGTDTWRQVWDLEIHPGNPDIVYASTSELYRSTDGGRTFKVVPGAPTAGYRMLIAVTPDEPSWVYLLRGARDATEGVSLSVNDGLTFTPKGAASEVGCDQAWYDYAFAANPTDADELAAGCLWIYHSDNQGAEWRMASRPSYHVDIHGLFFRKDGILFATTDGGVYRHPGGSFEFGWDNLNNNLNIGQAYRVGVHRSDYDRICSGRQDNGTDIADGGDFRHTLPNDGFDCFWNPTGTLFYGQYQNGNFHSCPYRPGRFPSCNALPDLGEAGSWDTPWAHHPTKAGTLYAGRVQNMFKSIDSGTSWTRMGTVGGIGSIRNFRVAPSDNRVIYVLKGGDVHRTSDGGQTWSRVRSGALGSPILESVAVSATNPDDVWVTMSGYEAANKVFHSLDGGRTWVNETSTGLPNLPANTVVVDDVSGVVYVGLDVGVYYRPEGQTGWSPFTDGLPNVSIRELEIAQKGSNPNDRRLLAATYGRGVWRTRLWGDVPVAAGPKAPILRRFQAVVAGRTLKVRFQAGADQAPEGMATLRLSTVEGTVLHQERVPTTGYFERDISLARFGKGILYFVLETGGGRVSRRVAVY